MILPVRAHRRCQPSPSSETRAPPAAPPKDGNQYCLCGHVAYFCFVQCELNHTVLIIPVDPCDQEWYIIWLGVQNCLNEKVSCTGYVLDCYRFMASSKNAVRYYFTEWRRWGKLWWRWCFSFQNLQCNVSAEIFDECVKVHSSRRVLSQTWERYRLVWSPRKLHIQWMGPMTVSGSHCSQINLN